MESKEEIKNEWNDWFQQHTYANNPLMSKIFDWFDYKLTPNSLSARESSQFTQPATDEGLLVEALKWYQEKAESAKRYMEAESQVKLSVVALMTELSLDGGKRAIEALQKYESSRTQRWSDKDVQEIKDFYREDLNEDCWEAIVTEVHNGNFFTNLEYLKQQFRITKLTGESSKGNEPVT